MKQEKILVTGANGQIGLVLTKALREKYGQENVIATDIVKHPEAEQPFRFLDILNEQRFYELVHDLKITQIYHLAAILSANGEWNPLKTWNINLNGLITVLEFAKDKHVEKVYFPSTMGVFGSTTPKNMTPQDVPILPETVYGISKYAGEMWCNYYHNRYGVDVRSVRYPGIIGHQSMPHGGTTDYAVEIYHEALKNGHYTCFLDKGTYLPMMYMEDAIQGTLRLMERPSEEIKIRSSYNIASMSFAPEEIAAEIRKHIPEFTIDYNPDFRQAIAESWTHSIDDHCAREDWGWQPKYDLKAMTEDMLYHLKMKLDV